MAYSCTLVDRSEQPTLVVRTRASVERLPQVLGPAWGSVMAHASKLGAEPSGPPFVAYHNMDMKDLDLEIGLPFARPMDGEGDVLSARLPAGQAVETVHVGPYDQLGTAYEALEAWMKTNGRVAGGPPHEHYLNDPEDTPPGELRTRIVWPLL
jgi:effector-binding domain-containing protein